MKQRLLSVLHLACAALFISIVLMLSHFKMFLSLIL